MVTMSSVRMGEVDRMASPRFEELLNGLCEEHNLLRKQTQDLQDEVMSLRRLGTLAQTLSLHLPPNPLRGNEWIEGATEWPDIGELNLPCEDSPGEMHLNKGSLPLVEVDDSTASSPHRALSRQSQETKSQFHKRQELLHKKATETKKMTHRDKYRSKKAKELSGDIFRERILSSMQQPVNTKVECCKPVYYFVRVYMDICIGAVIASTTVVTFLQWEWEGYEANVALGLDSPGGWQHAALTFNILEHAFNAIFTCELAARFAVYKSRFFLSPFNLFDALIVIISDLDAYVLTHLNRSGGSNVGFARLLRFARFTRTLRLVREFQIFAPLRILMRTIISSFYCLLWSLVVLGMCQMLAALVLCQGLAQFILDESQDYETRLWVNRMYGSSTKAFYTMFEVTFSGCWPNYVRPILEDVNTYLAFFLVSYVVVVVFAIIRIVTALFLKDTLKEADNDVKLQLDLEKQKRREFQDKLLDLFEAADTSGDGYLSLEEFEQVFSKPVIQDWCRVIGIEANELHNLFELLHNGDGLITYYEFLNNMSRIKGPASAQDVIAILHDCHCILSRFDVLQAVVDELVGVKNAQGTADK